MVKLTPAQQARFVGAAPGVFAAVKGAWGRRGSTSVRIDAAGTVIVRNALVAAWHSIAPKRALGEDASGRRA